MKPLTRYAMGTGMNVEPHMAPWPEGKFYRVDQVDARIAELEAERDAARADAERYREACSYALAAHYGRLSPMHNHWAAVIEKAMVQDTKSDAARGKE